MISVTCRSLGTGFEAAGHSISAAQAELIASLPEIPLPDLDELRMRGVLEPQPAVPEARVVCWEPAAMRMRRELAAPRKPLEIRPLTDGSRQKAPSPQREAPQS